MRRLVALISVVIALVAVSAFAASFTVTPSVLQSSVLPADIDVPEFSEETSPER